MPKDEPQAKKDGKSDVFISGSIIEQEEDHYRTIWIARQSVSLRRIRIRWEIKKIT